MVQDLLISPSGDGNKTPQMLFTGSGALATDMELNVLPDTTLSYESSEGEVFSISKNLQSGVIFAVKDISGLDQISVSASGEMHLAPYYGNVRVGATGVMHSDVDYSLDVQGNGLRVGASGIESAGPITYDGDTHAAVSECTGRLTGVTGEYVSPSGTGNVNIVYFCGPTGEEFRTWLWDGTAYTQHINAQISMSMVGYGLNGYPVDIWMQNASGVPTLSLTSWTNGSTRATALAMDSEGIVHRNGSQTHRYLGTLYLHGDEIFRDEDYSRGIWNFYNQRPRPLFAPYDNAYWTYASATVRQSDANTTVGEMRCDWIAGLADTEVNLVHRQAVGYSGTGWAWNGIGINALTDSAQINNGFYVSANSRWGTIQSEYRGNGCALGVNYGQCLEASAGGVTLYFYGIDGANYRCGLFGSVTC